MVRHYKRKTEPTYTLGILNKAVKEVRYGVLKPNEASRKYGIPRTTIVDRVNLRRGAVRETRGRPTPMNFRDDKRIASSFHIMEKNGFGLTSEETKKLVTQQVIENKLATPFEKEGPGNDFLLNMNGCNEAPRLDHFFSTFSRGTPFCSICLRTSQETKLVYNNEAVKAFASAIKMDIKWKRNNICYICEFKALKALQFFRSLTFAAALDTIFAEVLQQKRNNVDIFQKNNFKKITDKFDIPATRRLPSTWEADFTAVRNSTTLKETKTLVFSVDGKTQLTQVPPNEIYLIPDQPPDTENTGEVTEILRNNPDCDALNMRGNYMHRLPGILKLREELDDNFSETTAMLSTTAGPLQTLVILDDEDSNEQSIKIAKVESQAPRPPERPPNLHPTPRLVPIENLLEKPVENLFKGPKEVFTGNSLLLMTPNGPNQLHPIAIKEGVTVVPSLDAEIVDGVLRIGNKPMLNISQNPLDLNHVAFSQNDNNRNTILKNLLDKELNIRDSMDEMAIPVKKSKVLPPSEEDKSRIDWEDKIPMDVISFVDAVDPNPLIETPKNGESIRPPKWTPVRPHPPTKNAIDPQPVILMDASVNTESYRPPKWSPVRRGPPNKDSEEMDPLSIELSKAVESIGPPAWLPVRRRGRPPKQVPKIEDTNDIIDLC